MNVGSESHNNIDSDKKTLGLVKKGMEKFTRQIADNIKMQEQQKITLLGASHILRKAISIK